jgi:hypothetical protein
MSRHAAHGREKAQEEAMTTVPAEHSTAPMEKGLRTGALGFVSSCIDLAKPANPDSRQSWLGVRPPLAITVLALILGLILIGPQWKADPTFFRRKREVADLGVRI